LAFRASRCFRKELRRVILAFATRTASVLVGFCFGWDAGAARLSTVGILGSTCVGIVEARSAGCILIGPVTVLFLGMSDNSFLPNLFKRQSYCCPAAANGTNLGISSMG
jgi:hypothetical protein